ncbi:hypothetical protein K470DRAFT_195129, partial [Piedraia hortae CBS 480.64]
GTTGHADTTVDQQVNPAVEHEKITRKHEDREQTVIDQERHKHHYHTTVQPLKDREVEAAQHEHRQEETQYRNIDKDTGDAKGEAEKQQAKFGNTSKEGKTEYSTTKEPTVHQGGSVHHHLHETIQPVIEKGMLYCVFRFGISLMRCRAETIKPTVTHTTKPIHETITEKSENHGITRESAISVDEFKKRLGGE